MRVLVTGGRDFSTYEDRMWLYDGLKLLQERVGTVTEIIEGGANGADLAAKNWALWRQSCGQTVKLTTVPAQWELHGRGAGPIRNVEMARLKPDVVLACPGGRGTDHMVETARAHGLKVIFLDKMPAVRPVSRVDPASPSG